MNISSSELMETLREQDIIPEMMVMEYLPGTEYTVDVLAERGHVLKAVCRKGMRVVSSIMMDSVMLQNEDALALCGKVTALLKIDGNVGFDIKENAAGCLSTSHGDQPQADSWCSCLRCLHGQFSLSRCETSAGREPAKDQRY